MFTSYLHGVSGLYQVRTRHHKLLTSCIDSSLDDVLQVILMHLFAVICTPENGVAEVDADLADALAA
jgi:hypothetical protein